ncbi:hypothetical protein GOBAR_AA09492 [Gossypium barbadense]|uniref:Enoyl reductase (ER) domain-containing protein n=1 Tax=Gossypium barbadense TaxID=3634 RepID=A0A2P5Y6C9_GOSBA|nr:hypothetical protein GOBAR_AA09492 [Gossypium barbadense]
MLVKTLFVLSILGLINWFFGDCFANSVVLRGRGRAQPGTRCAGIAKAGMSSQRSNKLLDRLKLKGEREMTLVVEYPEEVREGGYRSGNWCSATTLSWARVGPTGGRPSRDTCSAFRRKARRYVTPPYHPRIKILFTLCHTDVYFWDAKGQNPLFPRILGHEAGGIVESVGEGVTDLKPGDHVLPIFTGECKQCPYCLSEESNMCDLLRINTDRVGMINDGTFRWPRSIPHAPLDKVCVLSCGMSTGSSCFTTCFGFVLVSVGATVNVAKHKKGQSVAIFGLGAVGLAAAEGARVSGASRIIGVDLNSSRFEQAKKFGFIEFVNPKDYNKPVQEVIVEMTGGGVDRSVEWRGVAVLVGVPNKDNALKTHSVNLLNEKTLKGTFFGKYKPRSDIPAVVENINKELKLDKFITHTVPFSEINKAFKLMMAGEGLRCVIRMDA